MDVSAVCLNKLLVEQNLDMWSKIKLAHLDPAYTSLFSAIKRHYSQYHKLPSFDELEITLRDGAALNSMLAVKLTQAEDISADVAIDALIDQFTQNEAIKLLEKYVDNLPIYDTAEIKENLSNIVLQLDQKTHASENVYTMSGIMLFKRPEELARDRTYLGINNSFDSSIGGVARQELILIGGKRGAGKSIVSNNICTNQYEAGFTSAYFTIEMIAHETLERTLSILANVNHQDLKKNQLTDTDLLKVIRTRAAMFVDADEVVHDYLKHRDKYKFEEDLVKSKQLKETNQLIIIDDRALTLTAMDLHLSKLKAQFGENLKLAVVDYVNQMVIESSKTFSQFDWQPQVIISKGLKELARKHDVVIVSPYQIDDTGQARFAKGILDAADIAIILEAHEKEKNAISFETTKIRGAAEMHFTSGMNWETLRVSPQSIDRPESEKMKRVKKEKDEKRTGEPATDVPWE